MKISSSSVILLKKSIYRMIYLPFVLLGGWRCRSFVIAPVVQNQQVIIAERERIKAIQEAPTTGYFEYFSITSSKDLYALGEPIDMYSHRAIYQSHRLEGTDMLRCDKYDGEGFGIISSTSRGNNNPEILSRRFEKRQYQGTLPQNPYGTYSLAGCMIISRISMVVDGVSKPQAIRSNLFYIGLKKPVNDTFTPIQNNLSLNILPGNLLTSKL